MIFLLLLDFWFPETWTVVAKNSWGRDLASNVLDWFGRYLDGRKQKVRKKDSSWKAVTAGVPQRLVGGPLPFSIFINDMPACLKFCRHHMFGDDCQIYMSSSPNEVPRAVEDVNNDLRSVELWAERNELKLNSQKMHMICMGTSRGVRSMKTYVNNNPIQIYGHFLAISRKFQEPGNGFGREAYVDSSHEWHCQKGQI
jgi:hypothetical protein